MIDALFGSKTRVKLLHLFLNNPGKSFYVREITRLIDEQINSVRRELSNMMGVGIITSQTDDNKLYYEVNQRYEYYVPLRAIFADEPVEAKAAAVKQPAARQAWTLAFEQLPGVRLVVTAGVLVRGSASGIDILVIGDTPPAKVKAVVKAAEKAEGRELNYTTMPYEEFYYRLSVRDKFVTEIINGKHAVLVDTDKLLNN
ncbi:transcriptional regulator [Candidatus Mycosynbacter amalyticus]|uniref:Transcriptional regulator n=1 Tax=Candidatus Mycosynbacter amalyticus TaxID=2665156 RepID=A0A857MP56_9BACT|nr:transcriptional regulator [Candidatus Mycosynbacter amalyticus]QHN42450.1 transcriptional regulator [Candidatus Mycosynbacter amalyticus]